MRRRMLGPGLAILLGATCAWAQMRGVGARPAAGGFGAATSVARPSTGGFRSATFSRPQTTMPQNFRPMQPARNFPSSNRNFGARLNWGRNRNYSANGLSRFFSSTYNPTVFFPPYFNSFYGWGFPYSPYGFSYPPYGAYGPYSPGSYPYAGAYPGYYGDPYGPVPAQSEPNDSADATVLPRGNPPRADALDEDSAFHRPDPRSVAITLDDVNVPVPADGGPIIIGSGHHTLRLTTQPDEPGKDSKTGRKAGPEKPSQ